MTVLSAKKREIIKRMEEAAKPKRELQAIQADYTQLCKQAGEVQYKITCLTDTLHNMNARIREFNQEAAQLQEKQNGKADTGTETGTNANEPGASTGEASLPPPISEHSGSTEHREDAQQN